MLARLTRSSAPVRRNDSLASRIGALSRTPHTSIPPRRTLCDDAPQPAAANDDADAQDAQDAAPKFKNLFELLSEQPRYGVGSLVYRVRWAENGWDPQAYHWQVTRVKIWRKGTHMRGKAWGVLRWKGMAYPVEQKLRSACKREWSAIDEPVSVQKSRKPPELVPGTRLPPRRVRWRIGSPGAIELSQEA